MRKEWLLCLALLSTGVLTGAPVAAEWAQNPIIWADVPDVAVIRVGDTYYMSSTTMHMSPGLPIMKSADLVNWELVGYAYDTLAANPELTLADGNNAYGAGSWASSLRYHNATYYVSTFSSTSGKTHVYTTPDIENTPWQETAFTPSLHDHSLFFDDDGRVYMLYGAGDLRLVELTRDVSGIQPGGFHEVVIANASAVAGSNVGLRAEGSQLLKVNGMYYVMNITWPRRDMRTQIIHRSDKITGPYEGNVILHDGGIAQGCLIDTPNGDWYAVLFKDNGAVGRVPYLVPVSWEDGWPVLGVEGKVPMTLDIPAGAGGLSNLVVSDEFNRQPDEPKLPLAWQWNHNPDPEHWSLDARPGWMRLTTGRVDSQLTQARNTLTQRTFGPACSAAIGIDVSNMNDGDTAGLALLQKVYGFVGVRMEGGTRSIVMEGVVSDSPVEQASVPIDQPVVYLRADCDFRDLVDTATFYYSLNGSEWIPIGTPLHMEYTLPHFMGYRFGLFNFAAESAGGFVDVDFFRVDQAVSRVVP